MIRTVWTWLGTPAGAKWFSAIAAIFLFIAAVGETGSYLKAFNSLVVFWAVWTLGRSTVMQDQGKERMQPVPLPDEASFQPPFDNCSFRLCDLPGQCRGEGKCHHPAAGEKGAQV